MNDKEFIQALKTFVKTIGRQPFGLVAYNPESDAAINGCFTNAERKVSQSGGSVQYGWMFVHKYTADFTSVGYFMAVHHAVWKNPLGRLIDVTPFHPELQHQPINVDKQVYFLVDDKAVPIRLSNGVPAPLLTKFFPLNNGHKLAAYVEMLKANEEIECQRQHQLMEQSSQSNSH